MHKHLALLALMLLPFIVPAQPSAEVLEAHLFQKLQKQQEIQKSFQWNGTDRLLTEATGSGAPGQMTQRSSGNRFTMNHSGSFNTIAVTQDMSNYRGKLTAGSGNEARVHISGNRVDYRLLQVGRGNVTADEVSANRAAKTITQFGQGNVLESSTAGNDLKHEIHQTGEANYLKQQGFQSVPLIIQQKGKGMHVRINGR